MNKKLIAMTTSLIIGGTLLLGTAYVNASQLSGYETFKAAIKDTKNLKNETANLKVSVSDNGSSLVDLTSNVKLNVNSNAMSSNTTIKSGNSAQSFSSYMQDGKSITKSSSSNQYLVFENKHMNLSKVNKTENPEIQKSMEIVIDTLVGSMKDKITTTENSDGSKGITASIGENDVTPLANALASMALIMGNEGTKYNDKADVDSIKNMIPKLVSDIKIESINSTGDISKDDVITDGSAKILVSGKDAQGKQHEITIDVSMNLSNINGTTPDKIDLTGKQVKTITSNFRGGHIK